MMTDFRLPPWCCLNVHPGAHHVYHQYVVRSKHRDALRGSLQTRGIGTLVHNPVPIHRQPAHQARIRCAGSLVNTERAAEEILSLPMYPELTPEQIHQVVRQIVAWDHCYQQG